MEVEGNFQDRILKPVNNVFAANVEPEAAGHASAALSWHRPVFFVLTGQSYARPCRGLAKPEWPISNRSRLPGLLP